MAYARVKINIQKDKGRLFWPDLINSSNIEFKGNARGVILNTVSFGLEQKAITVVDLEEQILRYVKNNSRR